MGINIYGRGILTLNPQTSLPFPVLVNTSNAILPPDSIHEKPALILRTITPSSILVIDLNANRRFLEFNLRLELLDLGLKTSTQDLVGGATQLDLLVA